MMEKELEEQQRYNQEMIDQLKSEPLYNIAKKQKVSDTPNWRKKKIRKIALAQQPKEEPEDEEVKEIEMTKEKQQK